MPINVFGFSSNFSENKLNTSTFLQKPYLRTIYIEANIEEDIELKKQFRSKRLAEPISIREAASKLYIDYKIFDPSVIKNTAQVDFIDKIFDNDRFVRENSLQLSGNSLHRNFTLMKLFLIV